jgi:hypothetical protein
VIVPLLLVPRASAQDLPGGGPSPLLYLHPLANYREDPEWVRAWERSLQSANSLRVNIGSVSTDDFLTDVELHLTEPIASRFRLLYDLRWFEALHVETRDTQHFLGFEFGLLPGLGLQGQINPTSRKEEVDLRFGMLLHTPDRAQFARVLVRWDDPLFDDKNGVDAVGEQTATSLEWTGRGVLGPFELFSRGLYGSGTERSYPDSVQVPEPFSETGRLNGSVTRLRLIADRGRFAEFEVAHHDFETTRVRRVDGVVERYDNRLLDLALRGVWRFDDRWRARAALHRLDQQAFVSSNDYSREEWMPAGWIRWSANAVHAIEVGYMGTSYDWTGSPDVPESESGYKQKLELAWLIEPSERVRLQFSLSHEPDPQRFGGANVQVQVGF